jgi:hypothetical protein
MSFYIFEVRSARSGVQRKVRFTQGVVLAEIVIPEQFTGIEVVVKEGEMKKGRRFVEVELWSFEFPYLNLGKSGGYRDDAAERALVS